MVSGTPCGDTHDSPCVRSITFVSFLYHSLFLHMLTWFYLLPNFSYFYRTSPIVVTERDTAYLIWKLKVGDLRGSLALNCRWIHRDLFLRAFSNHCSFFQSLKRHDLWTRRDGLHVRFEMRCQWWVHSWRTKTPRNILWRPNYVCLQRTW